MTRPPFSCMMLSAFILLICATEYSLASIDNGTVVDESTTMKSHANKANNTTEKPSSKTFIPVNSSMVNITGGPSKSGGLPGDTIDMPYTERLMIAFGIITVAMIVSLFVCYRKECNVMYWRYKKKSPRVKYEPLKVKMQVPPDV